MQKKKKNGTNDNSEFEFDFDFGKQKQGRRCPVGCHPRLGCITVIVPCRRPGRRVDRPSGRIAIACLLDRRLLLGACINSPSQAVRV
jgi:hypothetical protein